MTTAVAMRASRCRVALPHHVVVRSFVSETVMLDVDTGRYFQLNSRVGAMLDTLIGERSLAAAVSRLARGGWGSEDDLVTEALDLCSELEQLGLIRLQAGRL